MTGTNNWTRRLKGYAPMSPMGMKVLNYLLEAKAQDWPFVPLPDVHPRTLKALFSYDLIDVSRGDDDTRYKITVRGERTLKAYSQPARRSDGLCPDCGTRPRHVTASGRMEVYCLDCGCKAKRRAYRLKRPAHKPDRNCSRCHKRAVCVTPSGLVSTYCQKCKNLLNRRWMRRYRRNGLQRPQPGLVGRPRKSQVQP